MNPKSSPHVWQRADAEILRARALEVDSVLPPVVWGISLDFVGTYEVVTGVLHWKRHSIYFAALFLLNLVTILQVHRVREAHE